MLLAGGFLRLALVAMVIAMPLAAWAMHGWLQDFVYRAEMVWWVFVVAGLDGNGGDGGDGEYRGGKDGAAQSDQEFEGGMIGTVQQSPGPNVLFTKLWDLCSKITS